MGTLLLPNECGGIGGHAAGRILLVWKNSAVMMVPQGPHHPESAEEEEYQMLPSWVLWGTRHLPCLMTWLGAEQPPPWLSFRWKEKILFSFLP